MKTILTHTLKTLLLGLIFAASSPHADAAVINHTYVSGYGSDANPCTYSQPCASFQAALTNTSLGGIISALNVCDYGPVTIFHSVTIDGSTGTQASIVTGAASAITISAESSDTVILCHLRLIGLAGSGTGIVLNSGALVMDDCTISGFGSNGFYLTGSSSAVAEDTKITGCNQGIYDGSSGQLSLRNITLQGSSFGLIAVSGPVDISHSLITQNSNEGLYASATTLNVLNCIITGNGTAVYAANASIIRLTNNDIFSNTTGISVGTGTGIVSTAGNNRKGGNATSGAPTPGKVIVVQ